MSTETSERDELTGEERHELEAQLAEERRQEAQAAVAEQPAGPDEGDNDPDAPDEPTPPAEPEPTEEELAQAQVWIDLEKAQATYHRRVAKLLGDENVPPLCQHCEGTGFDQSGGQADLEYTTASNMVTCDECDGLGSVRTGSKVPGRELAPCGRCAGAGYLVEGPAEVRQPNMVAPVIADAANGNANAEELLRVAPGQPGWEPWMGTPPQGR